MSDLESQCLTMLQTHSLAEVLRTLAWAEQVRARTEHVETASSGAATIPSPKMQGVS